jgi:predicted metal-dependent hydrolase
MKSIASTISYGKTEIDYELLIMNRKSLEIAVHPDKSIVVKAPQTSTLEAIEKKIKKRARWIKRQSNYSA